MRDYLTRAWGRLVPALVYALVLLVLLWALPD